MWTSLRNDLRGPQGKTAIGIYLSCAHNESVGDQEWTIATCHAMPIPAKQQDGRRSHLSTALIYLPHAISIPVAAISLMCSDTFRECNTRKGFACHHLMPVEQFSLFVPSHVYFRLRVCGCLLIMEHYPIVTTRFQNVYWLWIVRLVTVDLYYNNGHQDRKLTEQWCQCTAYF